MVPTIHNMQTLKKGLMKLHWIPLKKIFGLSSLEKIVIEAME
jgi:hypothetical protein